MADDSNIYVTVEQEKHPVLCGLCKNPISSRIDIDAADDVGCIPCNTRATNNQVLATVQQYFQDQQQNLIVGQLAKAARGSKSLTFKGKTVAKGSYKFIV